MKRWKSINNTLAEIVSTLLVIRQFKHSLQSVTLFLFILIYFMSDGGNKCTFVVIHSSAKFVCSRPELMYELGK